jgi:hypothetical protein
MSRGTRVSGDVMGNIPEWALRDEFPEEVPTPCELILLWINLRLVLGSGIYLCWLDPFLTV